MTICLTLHLRYMVEDQKLESYITIKQLISSNKQNQFLNLLSKLGISLRIFQQALYLCAWKLHKIIS